MIISRLIRRAKVGLGRLLLADVCTYSHQGKFNILRTPPTDRAGKRGGRDRGGRREGEAHPQGKERDAARPASASLCEHEMKLSHTEGPFFFFLVFSVSLRDARGEEIARVMV